MKAIIYSFFTAGMPLPDIIKAVTVAPAQAVGFQDTIGMLEIGKIADITALEIVEREVSVEDALGNIRNLTKIFVPKIVWRKGIRKDIL